MSISPFFQELRAAYQAELDDLNSDSEGHYILDKRLAEKRKELDFLLQMMDLNPEMVAVVLHQAFEFHAPELMAHFITRDCTPDGNLDKFSRKSCDSATFGFRLMTGLPLQTLGYSNSRPPLRATAYLPTSDHFQTIARPSIPNLSKHLP
jgi:hypothetical protein